MFRYKKSVPASYEKQGYIYFKSLCYRELPEKDRCRIRKLCIEAGGEYYQALFDFVTTREGATSICMRYHLSQSTLERVVRKYYASFPRYL